MVYRSNNMNLFITGYLIVLFFVLTPGVLLSLPPKSSKYVVALTHAVVFGLVYGLTHKHVWRLSHKMGHRDGFQEGSVLNNIGNAVTGGNSSASGSTYKPTKQ